MDDIKLFPVIGAVFAAMTKMRGSSGGRSMRLGFPVFALVVF
jgi:hypothetical protein